MQEAVHFKKLNATSTASYGCTNFSKNQLKYCCGVGWLRKGFLVWHVYIHSFAHMVQQAKPYIYFMNVDGPTISISSTSTTMLTSLSIPFFWQQLSPIPWTFHTCQAPGRNENNDRVVQGIVVVRDPLVLRVTLWCDTRNTLTCTCTVVAYCNIIIETCMYTEISSACI